MSKIERIFGNIMVTILMLLMTFSILSSMFSFVFRGIGDVSAFGTRGGFYYIDYDY